MTAKQQETHASIQRWLEEVFKVPTGATSFTYERLYPHVKKLRWYRAEACISAEYTTWSSVVNRLRRRGWTSARSLSTNTFTHPDIPGATISIRNKMYSHNIWMTLSHCPGSFRANP